MRQAAVSISPAALDQVRLLLDKRGKSSVGIRIGLKTKGCNGLAYNIEYADEQYPMDECISVEEVKILIDPKALMFLIGTEMDFVSDKFQSGFVFNNPNEKGRCGCGKSFHV